MKFFLSILLLTIAIVPCQAQKVKPALNLTKGNTYYSISDLNTSIAQTMNGQQVTYTIGMSTKTAYKVLDIKDTVYNLEVTYKNIGMKMQAPGAGNIEYNSGNKDAKDVASQILYAMVDKPFLITLSKSGKVIAVQNVEKMMQAVFKSVTLADTVQLQQFKNQFMQSFGEKAFKSNLEETFAIYPSIKVAKGDKWTVGTKLQSVMEANVYATYELIDITPDSYLIHGEAKVTSASSSTTQMSGMPVKYNLSGTTFSEIKADKTTGWITESKQKEDLSGDISILDNPKLPGGMQMPMTIHANIITTDQ